MASAKESSEARFVGELALLLGVPYPLVLLRSLEEAYALDALRSLCMVSRKKLATWSLVGGTESDPLHSLVHQLDRFGAGDDSQVLALLEPGELLHRPEIQRRLQELALHQRGKTVVVIGSSLSTPESLSRVATTLNAPLPSRPVIAQVLDDLMPRYDYPHLPRERMTSAALGLTRGEARRAFLRAQLGAKGSKQEDQQWERAIIEEKRRSIGQDEIVEFIELREGLHQVGGLDELKLWLQTRAAAFSQEARDYGLPVPRGLLLVGVQGCGKSLVAKSVASYWGLPLLRLDLGRIFAGNSAPDAALHRALAVAEALAPSVLWTDEIEKGFAQDAGGPTRRVLGTLLTWLQEKESEVFFVSTANEVKDLPPELLRKGRFDELFFVDLPDRQARTQILGIHLEKRGRTAEDYDLAALAQASENFSGAEIEEAVVAALYEAFADGRELTTQDLLQVMEETMPLYATRQDDIKELRDWAKTRTRFATSDRKLVDFFS